MPVIPDGVVDQVERSGYDAIDVSYERLTDFVAEKPIAAIAISLVLGILVAKFAL